MLYTAYFDEADTHGPSPTIIMAGFLGTAREWQLFDRRLRALQRRDGFTTFHVKQFKRKSGEFAGWSYTKCMKLVNDLTKLVRDELTEGLTVHLEHERYLTEYRAPPVPKGMRLDSQYGICFRACMRQVLEIVMADGKPHRLDVVIEHGHRNARDTIEIFNDVKRRLKERRGLDLLGEIVTAKKHERAPLMVADFLASTYSMMRASRARGQIDDAELAPDPPKGQARLTFLELLPDALHRLKEDFEADRQEAVTAWRACRPHAVGDKA
jgi:hypothetical protein